MRLLQAARLARPVRVLEVPLALEPAPAHKVDLTQAQPQPLDQTPTRVLDPAPTPKAGAVALPATVHRKAVVTHIGLPCSVPAGPSHQGASQGHDAADLHQYGRTVRPPGLTLCTGGTCK